MADANFEDLAEQTTFDGMLEISVQEVPQTGNPPRRMALSTVQTGLIGPQGPAGTDGQDGATGQTGPAGQDGATGAQGAQGAAGQDGTDGQDGATGQTGPAGQDGTGGTSLDWATPTILWQAGEDFTDRRTATSTTTNIPLIAGMRFQDFEMLVVLADNNANGQEAKPVTIPMAIFSTILNTTNSYSLVDWSDNGWFGIRYHDDTNFRFIGRTSMGLKRLYGIPRN